MRLVGMKEERQNPPVQALLSLHRGHEALLAPCIRVNGSGQGHALRVMSMGVGVERSLDQRAGYGPVFLGEEPPCQRQVEEVAHPYLIEPVLVSLQAGKGIVLPERGPDVELQQEVKRVAVAREVFPRRG